MTPLRIGPPPMNPLSRLLASMLAAVVLIGALFFGVFVFLIAVGLGLVAWAVLWLRIWWIRRRAERSGEFGPAAGRPGHAPRSRRSGSSGEVIEGEYTVVSESEQERDESKAR